MLNWHEWNLLVERLTKVTPLQSHVSFIKMFHHSEIVDSVRYAGMPYPQNFETAKAVEAIVRESGATPATIAILNGVPCIGKICNAIIFPPFISRLRLAMS